MRSATAFRTPGSSPPDPRPTRHDPARHDPARHDPAMRNATLDHARLAAAAGIVLFHAGAPGAWLGYAALPFFLMLLIQMAAPTAARQPLGAYAAGRARRLLLPWLWWSGVYALMKLADVVLAGSTLGAEFAPWMLATGPAIHLWFLPFAFVACLALWPLARAAAGLDAARRMALVMALAMAAVAALMLRHALVQGGTVLGAPFAQWTFALPAVALGAGLALLPGWRAGAGLAVTTGLALALAGWPPGSTQLALAAGLLLACHALPMADSAGARRAAGLALTVYLAHPLLAAVLMRATPLPDASLGLALATLAASLLLAMALERGQGWLGGLARLRGTLRGKRRTSGPAGRTAEMADDMGTAQG